MIAEMLAVAEDKVGRLENVNQELASQKSNLDDIVLKLNETNKSLEAELKNSEYEKEMVKENVERLCVTIQTLEESLKDRESKVFKLIVALIVSSFKTVT
jgi:septal ring factor EnvC (AmiA/AmiB activator)